MGDNLDISGQRTESSRPCTPTNQAEQPVESLDAFLGFGSNDGRLEAYPTDSRGAQYFGSLLSQTDIHRANWVRSLAVSPISQEKVYEMMLTTGDESIRLMFSTNQEPALISSSTDPDHRPKHPADAVVQDLADLDFTEQEISNVVNYIKQEWTQVINKAGDNKQPASERKDKASVNKPNASERKECIERLEKLNGCIVFKTIPLVDVEYEGIEVCDWKWVQGKFSASLRNVVLENVTEDLALQAIRCLYEDDDESPQEYESSFEIWLHGPRIEALAAALAKYQPHFNNLWERYKDVQALNEPWIDEKGLKSVDGRVKAKIMATHDLNMEIYVENKQIKDGALITSGDMVKKVFKECRDVYSTSYEEATIQIGIRPKVKPGEAEVFYQYSVCGKIVDCTTAIVSGPVARVTNNKFHIPFRKDGTKPVPRPSPEGLLDFFDKNKNAGYRTYLKNLLTISDEK